MYVFNNEKISRKRKRSLTLGLVVTIGRRLAKYRYGICT